jgi:hypothetical protein
MSKKLSDGERGLHFKNLNFHRERFSAKKNYSKLFGRNLRGNSDGLVMVSLF